MDKISLFARHSFNSCISKGYSFLANNLLLIVRVLMPYFTITALFTTLSVAYNVKLNVAIAADKLVTVEEIVVAMGLFTLAWFTYIVTMARMFLMFRRLTALEVPSPEDMASTKMAIWKRTITRTMQLTWRSLTYTIWFLVINMPGFPIISPCAHFIEGLSMGYKVLAMAVLLLFVLLVTVLFTPFIYTFYCRMMKPDVTLYEKEQLYNFSFKVAYKKAFRHKGKIFSLTLWSAFLTFIISTIILLPELVAMETYLSSVEGNVNFGDMVLIPVLGYVFMLVVSVVALSFCQLLGIAFYASEMYLFGDIYSKENNIIQ